MPRSPIRASLQARSKLKAFQFMDGKPNQFSEPPEADKENVGREARQRDGIAKGSQKNEVEQKIVPEALPSTPATRLPLAYLIGNGEDSLRRAPNVVVSPDEQIQWVPSRSPEHALRAGQWGKKRARSSSPASSSQQQGPNDVVNKSALNVQMDEQSWRPSDADPAVEVWNRYTINTNYDGARITPRAQTFAHLINVHSPRSSNRGSSAGSFGGLRRWASCGVEWPTSKSKRRKTTRVTEANTIDVCNVNSESINVRTAETSLSKVGFLVEKIHETLTNPSKLETPHLPSSSSPLPALGNSVALTNSQDRGEVRITAKNTFISATKLGDEAIELEGDLLKPSSHFGSDELDMSILDFTDISHTAKTRTQTQEAQDDAFTNKQKITGVTIVRSAHQGPDIADADFSDDLFDEFDGDGSFLGADFGNMASPYKPKTEMELGKESVESSQYFQYQHSPKVQNGQVEEPSAAGTNVSDDEFGDDGFDVAEFAAAEIAATQVLESGSINDVQAPSENKLRKIQRYLVVDVATGNYIDGRGRKCVEKVLCVQEEKTNMVKAITLRQSWLDTPCTVGSYVHVIGDFSNTGQCCIDDAQNMLILHPDHLISATVVADSFGCLRRAVLQDRVKATSTANPPQVYGHLLHEIFQEALTANQWDDVYLENLIEAVVGRSIEKVYEIHLTALQAIDHLKSKMPQLQVWSRVFVRAHPCPDGMVDDHNGKKVNLSVNKLLEVEEHVWSPRYGLKGNIDATVQVRIADQSGERTLAVPFEVKTGRNNSNASHRAQTALYTLLMSDRYEVEIAYGILYYLETSETSRIPAVRHELRHMVIQRNLLAGFIRQRLELPAMLKDAHICGKCYAKKPCFLYHKLREGGDGDTSGMRQKFIELTTHLHPVHRDFFKKWDDLLTKEESELMKYKRELWTLAKQRERETGQMLCACLYRASYTFVKQDHVSGFSFTDSQITTGEPIVISDEKGHFALANGYVTKVKKRHVTVAVDRRLHNARLRAEGFDAATNQVFTGIMEVKDHNEDGPSAPAVEREAQVYRIDKDEFSNGLATVRNNLLQIMAHDVYHAHELRRLIVEGAPPKFKGNAIEYIQSGPTNQTDINLDQRSAIQKVLSAEDYALILGMPGTGKTTTIALIIRTLVAKGKSVLLTSYTHTAVDNILLKIRDDQLGILRLGSIAKIHPEVQNFAIIAAQPRSSVEELQKMYHEPQIVATTCLGIGHQIFNERIFDYCIVDEASQITLPVCLGPIRMAKTFILVGDHYQLSPLVQNKEAQQGGLDISLFKSLSDRHPSSVVTLQHQYRMCEDVMALSNELVYDGRLKCGTEAVANRCLDIPDLEALKTLQLPVLSTFPSSSSHAVLPDAADAVVSTSSNAWLHDLLDPSRKVIFANTDPLLPSSRETARGSRITNSSEASIAAQILCALLAVGVSTEDIGVMTLYRSQLALLKQHAANIPCASGAIEMHTADRYQGRDKEVIILSLVRSNEQKNVGELAKDWRRMNVAFTRARTKLIVLGSKSTLVGDALLRRFSEMCEHRGWEYDLPAAAAEGCLPDEPKQVLSKKRQRSPEKHQRSPEKHQRSPLTSWQRSLEKESRGDLLVSPRKQGGRRPLQSCQPRAVKSQVLKVPEKKGRVGVKTLLKNKPVLADILNEALEGYGNEYGMV